MAENFLIINPLIGGIFIGTAAALMMVYQGKIAGISGIVNGLFRKITDDWFWRAAFIAGLISGGLFMLFMSPQSFPSEWPRSLPLVGIAGFVVGVGVTAGSGCTSGHGVCGIGRFSKRSIIATLVFIASGMVSVFVVNHLFGAAT